MASRIWIFLHRGELTVVTGVSVAACRYDSHSEFNHLRVSWLMNFALLWRLGHPFCRFQVLRGILKSYQRDGHNFLWVDAPEFLLMVNYFRFTMSYRRKDAKATGTC